VTQPLSGLWDLSDRLPRVETPPPDPAFRPWAGGHNPFGIGAWGRGKYSVFSILVGLLILMRNRAPNKRDQRAQKCAKNCFSLFRCFLPGGFRFRRFSSCSLLCRSRCRDFREYFLDPAEINIHRLRLLPFTLKASSRFGLFSLAHFSRELVNPRLFGTPLLDGCADVSRHGTASYSNQGRLAREM